MPADFVCGAGGTADGPGGVLGQLLDCCWGAINFGPAGCTCWVEEFDINDQADPIVRDMVVEAWPDMCADCAFRPDSPERTGDDRYVVPPDDAPFWCHRGMRRVLRWHHPALGITIEADGDFYRPPIVTFDASTVFFRGIPVDAAGRINVPFQADGSIARRCAGWAARRRADVHTFPDHERRSTSWCPPIVVDPDLPPGTVDIVDSLGEHHRFTLPEVDT